MMVNRLSNTLYTYSMYNAVMMSQQLKSGKSLFKSYFGANQANNINADAQSFVTKGKTSAQKLSDSIQDLMNTRASSSVYNSKTATSSNEGVLSIKNVTDKAKIGDSSVVKVDQTAAAQRNISNSVSSSGATALSAGTHKFEITSDKGTFQFSINVNSGDSNEAVQKKMADAINSKNTGLTAKVTSLSGSSTLSIAANQTGATEGAFTIQDISGGNAVANYGADNVFQGAQDALYSVDGIAQSSSSNDVDLGNGVTATLKKASTEFVNVDVKSDPSALTGRVQDMVSSFNDLLDLASSNSGDSKTARLASNLASTAKTYKSSLARLGINVSSSGHLSIDEKKLSKSIESGALQDYFESDAKSINYGFSYRVSKLANQVADNPMQFISKDSYTSNSGYNQFNMPNYFFNQGFSKTASMGLLFDTIF